MDDLVHDLRLLAARWRSEHRSVAADAYRLNVRTLQAGAPWLAITALLTALAAVWTLPAAEGPDRWVAVVLHAAMAAVLSVLYFAARQVTAVRHSPMHLGLSMLASALVLAYAAVLITRPDQDLGIAGWLLASILVATTWLHRPVAALLLFSGGYAVLWWLADPGLRVYAGLASLLAFGVSIRNWRTFTQMHVQGLELERTRTELQQRQRDLDRMTRQDGLTGLFNRKTFTELTQMELERAKRQGTPTSLLLVDLDHFKKINDTHGHPAGDAVLRHVATLLGTGVRNTDLVGRLGGEEFIILLPATTMESAQRLAEKLRQRLQTSPVLWIGKPIQITASFGLAVSTPFLTLAFDALYNSADKALYRAKSSGRNRVMT